MKPTAFAVAGAIALIGVMSAFLVVRGEPEYTYAVSDDDVMTVSGVARATQALTITRREGGEGLVGSTDVYTLAGDAALDVPVTLTAQTAVLDGAVYYYNETYRMWEALESERVADDLLAIQTRRLGDYAIGKQEVVEAPVFLDEYAALRAVAPEGAVGYAIVMGYAREGESSFVRLPGQGEQGGCGGAVMPGEREAQSVRERRASVLVNDVQTTVDLRFLATWHVADTGCAQLSPFLPSAEHATLPVSY